LSGRGEQTRLSKTIIIGIGNEFRGDDAAGLVVAKRLKTAQSTAEVQEQSGEGAALMASWTGYDSVIIIDAVEAGGEPGEIFSFDVITEPLPTKFFHYSTHNFSVAEAVETARALGSLPSKMWVYGIQGESFELGRPITERVSESIDQVVLLVLDRLNLLSSH
jgi:hydrogenase maturation protease